MLEDPIGLNNQPREERKLPNIYISESPVHLKRRRREKNRNNYNDILLFLVLPNSALPKTDK